MPIVIVSVDTKQYSTFSHLWRLINGHNDGLDPQRHIGILFVSTKQKPGSLNVTDEEIWACNKMMSSCLVSTLAPHVDDLLQ